MKKIVSIDDEPAMLSCLSNALQSKGYELIITSDPEEGLKILQDRDDICLAMLDVRMPKISGFDIFKEIRKTKKLPVLFVTAYPRWFNAESEEIAQMWQSEFADGTTDMIYKPFDLDALFEKVEGLVGEAQELSD
jgi:DNA-binding response OmpR family regulator